MTEWKECIMNDIDGNLENIAEHWNNLRWYQKIGINIVLFFGNLVRSDITRCPKCGRLTIARLASFRIYGWHFKTKCHRCNHEFEWSAEV